MRGLCLFLLSCGPAAAKVQIVVTPEATVTDGLQPGTGEDDIRDGWTVTYDKFLVSIGGFTAESSASGQTLPALSTYVVDLKSAASITVAAWDAAPGDVRFDRVGFALVAPAADSVPAPGLQDADFALMRNNHYSLYVVAKMTKGAATIRFAWGFQGETRYSNCGAEGGQLGFATTAGQATSIEPTIHGDHWFFTNYAHSTTPQRRADWIAKCDTDGNGDVSIDELKAHAAKDLFLPGDGYNLSSLPTQPIRNGFDYFAAQARTLVHFQGDGECETLEVLSRDPNEPMDLTVGD